jgi:NDT80 / PhoG like DNA-binding  family/Chaperone of endosialidase
MAEGVRFARHFPLTGGGSEGGAAGVNPSSPAFVPVGLVALFDAARAEVTPRIVRPESFRCVLHSANAQAVELFPKNNATDSNTNAVKVEVKMEENAPLGELGENFGLGGIAAENEGDELLHALSSDSTSPSLSPQNGQSTEGLMNLEADLSAFPWTGGFPQATSLPPDETPAQAWTLFRQNQIAVDVKLKVPPGTQFLLLSGEYCAVEGYYADIYAVQATFSDLSGKTAPDARAPLVCAGSKRLPSDEAPRPIMLAETAASATGDTGPPPADESAASSPREANSPSSADAPDASSPLDEQLFRPAPVPSSQVSGPVPELDIGGCFERIRFSSATKNNTRTSSPSLYPNQEFFRVVVALLCLCRGQLFHVACLMSDPLIVRGQNPGRYKKQQQQQKKGSGSASSATNAEASETPNAAPAADSQTPSSSASSSSSSSSSKRAKRSRPDDVGDAARGAVGSPHTADPTPWQYTPPAPGSAASAQGALWVPNSVRVGLGTESPQAALHVAGDIVMTGTLHKPSDRRLKSEVEDVNTLESLQNISRLALKEYDVQTWDAEHASDGKPGAEDRRVPTRRERGVIAQEVREIIPYAGKARRSLSFCVCAPSPTPLLTVIFVCFVRVHPLFFFAHSRVLFTVSALSGPSTLPDGRTVQNLLVVDERTLLFENVGATQELHDMMTRDRTQVESLGIRVRGVETGQASATQEAQTYHNEVRTAFEIATSRIDQLVDFVVDMQEEKRLRRSGRRSCLCCGLAPCWVVWLLGFLLPIFWFVGMAFLASPHRSSRRGGLFNFAFAIGYVFYWMVIFLLGRFVNAAITFSMGGAFHIFYWAFGIVAFIFMVTRRRKREARAIEERKEQRTLELLQERDEPIPNLDRAHVLTMISSKPDVDLDDGYDGLSSRDLTPRESSGDLDDPFPRRRSAASDHDPMVELSEQSRDDGYSMQTSDDASS